MTTFFPWAPGDRTTGRKKVRLAFLQAGGLLPFPRTGCVLYAEVDYTEVGEGRQGWFGRAETVSLCASASESGYYTEALRAIPPQTLPFSRNFLPQIPVFHDFSTRRHTPRGFFA